MEDSYILSFLNSFWLTSFVFQIDRESIQAEDFLVADIQEMDGQRHIILATETTLSTKGS